MVKRLLAAMAAAALLTSCCVPAFTAHAAAGLLKAKQEAENKGFVFETSRDEIIAKAKKEGKVRILSALDRETFKPMIESFKKKCPFIDVQIQEITGTEDTQRLILELNAGSAKDWDLAHAPDDFYMELTAHAKKV